MHFAGDGKVGLSKNQITAYEAEIEKMKKAGYGSSNKRNGWGDEDIKEYKKELRPKPGSRLIASVLKRKKKKNNNNEKSLIINSKVKYIYKNISGKCQEKRTKRNPTIKLLIGN